MPHKLVRNASSSISSDSFRKHTTEQESFVEMRQLDSRVICQQGRGNKVLSIVLPGLGDIQLVQNQEDCNTSCSHTREKECVSRRSVKGSTGSSDNRVESETRVSEPDFSEVLHSEHRPVCNEGEQEVASVLLPLSGSVGLGSRCTQCTLERNVCICVSPASIDTPGITESAEGAMFAGVAPHSPRQSWYPILLDLLVDIPRKLPITEDMLTQKKGQIRHADPESLNLVVWKISSLPPVRESFLQKLRSTLNRQEEPQHRGCTKQELQFTEAGVIDGIFVHIQPL